MLQHRGTWPRCHRPTANRQPIHTRAECCTAGTARTRDCHRQHFTAAPPPAPTSTGCVMKGSPLLRFWPECASYARLSASRTCGSGSSSDAAAVTGGHDCRANADTDHSKGPAVDWRAQLVEPAHRLVVITTAACQACCGGLREPSCSAAGPPLRICAPACQQASSREAAGEQASTAAAHRRRLVGRQVAQQRQQACLPQVVLRQLPLPQPLVERVVGCLQRARQRGKAAGAPPRPLSTGGRRRRRLQQGGVGSWASGDGGIELWHRLDWLEACRRGRGKQERRTCRSSACRPCRTADGARDRVDACSRVGTGARKGGEGGSGLWDAPSEPGAFRRACHPPSCSHLCSCSPPGCGREASPPAERRTPFPRLVSPTACPHAPRGAGDMNAGWEQAGGGGNDSCWDGGVVCARGGGRGSLGAHTNDRGGDQAALRRAGRARRTMLGGSAGRQRGRRVQVSRSCKALPTCSAQGLGMHCVQPMCFLSGGISCNRPVRQLLRCPSCPTRSVPWPNRYVTTAEEACNTCDATRRRAVSSGPESGASAAGRRQRPAGNMRLVMQGVGSA